MRKITLLFATLFIALSASADEGMWLLKELNKENLAQMKKLGFKFPEKNIYNENQPSLKDATVIFGGGCTGVTVSNKGLIFTNHHCGYSAIQKLSSVESDYLKNGFVSHTIQEELKAEGLAVSFLNSMEDITAFVMADVLATDADSTKHKKMDAKFNEYLAPYKDNEFLNVKIIPFYSGNKYYAVSYDVFKDVRLVFAPPSSVGKFGGETDNWMWPRHTGDFSVFRVYANSANEPVGYNENNIPYTPKYSVPVSIAGYKEGDYAMTIGYPGRTNRYLASWGIEQMVESAHKPRIEVRGAKQAIWKEAMNADDAIRIKYANKYAGSSNYWKNAMGMNEAIEKQHIIKDKKALENKFAQWVSEKEDRKAKYGNTLSMLANATNATMDIRKLNTYVSETFYSGIEIISFANTLLNINKNEKLDIAGKKASFKESMANKYKDYEPALDQKLMPALLALYAQRVDKENLPAIYTTIATEFNGSYEQYTDWVYTNTMISDLDGATRLIGDSLIENDPAIVLAKSIEPIMQRIVKQTNEYGNSISNGNRLFMAGLMEMEPNKAFYPDATFTQRLSYGSIGGYRPADAISYNYYSTTTGILEKEKPGDPEFNVQDYILNDVNKQNFGRYADKSGQMFVNFISNNDITGGNSGSPVFNGKAELIGLAFDGNWDALSGDISFNSRLQRCINVDIRYALYMIDKVMKCPRLIEELDIKK